MKKIAFSFLPFLLLGSLLPATGWLNHFDQFISGNIYDGPYVLYKNGKVYAEYIVEEDQSKRVKVDSVALSEKASISLEVATDDPAKTFVVRLKSKLKDEESEFSKIKKTLVLSDIEGNFGPFRKLLQANGVIDKAFNWTFGDGHLVLIGDFFDRGDQVTEVLWLIYSLEEKARAAGGYVHFVLGNHELMNMSGDLRYVRPKYIGDAALLNENYVMLYGENSELGRWLRTKNIIEKVGNTLFLHGGFSGAMNRLDMSINRINELSRPYYSDSTNNYPDASTELIFGSEGPFWYRGYYMGNTPNTSLQIDSTLFKYGVRHIATGHTIVADTVSSWYNGRLFDTDVHHAAGQSEALLIEDDKFYRINIFGERIQIF